MCVRGGGGGGGEGCELLTCPNPLKVQTTNMPKSTEGSGY